MSSPDGLAAQRKGKIAGRRYPALFLAVFT